MLLCQCSTLRTGTSPLRHRDTVLAGLGTAEDAKRNLQALGLVNLPSTFFSLHTLFSPLVPGSAIDFFFFPISICSSCLAKSSRICLARSRNGLGWAWHPLPLQCTKSSAVSAQAHCIEQGKALWGNSKSLPHCSFCFLLGEGMKASVVSWPIILITFGHEAWLE